MTDSRPQDGLAIPVKQAVQPTEGEVINSLATGASYIIGKRINEGNFSIVYACKDLWDNDLAAKVMKPTKTYEEVRESATKELQRLVLLRHPHITYVYDAFEYRDTFYIITERCTSTLSELFTLPNFNGPIWIRPIARCLLQAVEFLHRNQHAHQDIHPKNVFTAFARDEMAINNTSALHFKLGDLGISRVFEELNAANTLATWMRPPEALYPAEFGHLDHRIDIYHLGLLFLQLAQSEEIHFSREEILAGRPREVAMQLASPLNVALEKALRRHAAYRTASAAEFWRDLQTPPGL